MDYNELMALVVLSLAIAAVSITITKTKVFRSFREWIDERSDWFGELVHCPYCTSHWVAFAAVAYYQPRPVESGVFFVDLVVAAFAVICLTSWFGGLIYRAYRE